MKSAEKLLQEVVQDLGERVRQGQPSALLWDMDGTLVDTRPRMLAAVHAMGRTDVRMAQVSPSWQETANNLGLDRQRFQAVWQRVFWAYESFEADFENQALAKWARRAQSLGVQNIIITGRIEELRPVTLRQLEHLGIAAERIFLKSNLGDSTPEVKAQVIQQLATEGLCLGAFITDSLEEIAAITPEIRAQASQLQCIFVQLEGVSCPGLPPEVACFQVECPALRQFQRPPAGLLLGGEPITFGFEAEFEIESSEALLQLYQPQPSLCPDWESWDAPQKFAWIRSLFPDPHSEEFDLPLHRNSQRSDLEFLPEDLFVDSDGNIEIVSPPTSDLESLWNQLERLEDACGAPLLQVTVSVPRAPLLDRPGGLESLDGFLSFHQLLDTFERMATGHRLYLQEPDREVLLPFLHPWLGPPTRGKHAFLRTYLEANARGERLDEKWVRLVDRAFSSFKYINGTVYRPALTGTARIALEIRDGHRNKPLLARRLKRNLCALIGGLESYAAFARTWPFDSEADYDRLPQGLQQLLQKVFPSRERPEIDFMYSGYDRVALQVYRNFALPLKDYEDVELALQDGYKKGAIGRARDNYLKRLKQVSPPECSQSLARARREIQGALATFAIESQLHARLQTFSERAQENPPARAQRTRIHALLASMPDLPDEAWKGATAGRLQRLQGRWPRQISLREEAGGELSQLVISLDGLDPGSCQQLLEDYLRAVSQQSLSLSLSDRGSLQLRYGTRLFSPAEASQSAPACSIAPLDHNPELLLQLSNLESHFLGRHLAAHQPCQVAARRVSASGWLRHLVLGPESTTLERQLGLPSPPSIETAAEIWQTLRQACSASGRAYLVSWTAKPLTIMDPPLRLRPSRLDSGFPSSLRSQSSLQQRLLELSQRWPTQARWVAGVPFTFGKGSQVRNVLVLTQHGLEEAQAESFRRDVLDTLGADSISFPLRWGAEHLRTRIGYLAFALSPEGVRVDFYEPPWQRRRLEPMVELTPAEMDRLRNYVGRVIDHTLEVLGPITLEAGCRQTQGRLDNNRPVDGMEHNCTTWISLAPIGESGRNLAQLAEMPDSWTSHDNPGWWSMFLTGASRSPRVHTVLYWTDQRLEEAPVISGQPLPWDFNPR